MIGWQLISEKFHTIIGIVEFTNLVGLTQLWFSIISHLLGKLCISQRNSISFFGASEANLWLVNILPKALLK